MKNFLIGLTLLSCSLSFAEGEHKLEMPQPRIENPFTVEFVKSGTNRYSIRSTSNKQTSELKCDSINPLPHIAYYNRKNIHIADFYFDTRDQCLQFKSCILDYSADQPVVIKVDRDNNEIFEIHFPESCLRDRYASVIEEIINV